MLKKSNSFKFVKLQSKSKLDESGEVLSPKYAPEKIAPPNIPKLIPAAFPIIIRGIPTALTVPKEVPISIDIKLVIKNAHNINKLGFTYFKE